MFNLMLARDILQVELEIRIPDRPLFLLRADGTDSEGARLMRISFSCHVGVLRTARFYPGMCEKSGGPHFEF